MQTPIPKRHYMLAIVRDVFYPRLFRTGALLLLTETGNPPTLRGLSALAPIGLDSGRCSRLPNVVVDYAERGRLILVEIAECNGPIDSDRRRELHASFASIKRDLVFVTAFADMRTFAGFQSALAWGTSAWIAEAPDHLVVFNGQRLIGPESNTDIHTVRAR